jgi:DNA-binding NarL/FixJ family response regulator
LVSDFPILRDSLKAQIEKVPELELVACASSHEEVLPLLKSHRPQLVLLDLSIEWEDVCTLLENIHRDHDVRSLVMSDDLGSGRVMKVLRHGASGVVPRRTSVELFTKSISTVLAGDFWVSRAMVTDFVHQIRQAGVGAQNVSLTAVEAEKTVSPAAASTGAAPKISKDTSRFGLTPREVQIVNTLVDGQTNKDIADTIGISQYTVKHHLTNIYDKLGVYNRVELVLFAMNHGLCEVATPTAS